MVQVFIVLRCFSCETFQVHQVKKTNKWNCKVCNEKQSVIKTYGKGSAADCRRHVQKLNMLRGEKEQLEKEQLESSTCSHPPEDYADTFTTQDKQLEEIPQHPVVLAGKSAGKSKWTSFIEPEDEEEREEGDGTFTTERDEFIQAQKPRKQVKRSASDRAPHPLSSRTNLPSSSQNGSKERVYPYSCVSQEMEGKLDDHTDKLTSSRSSFEFPHSDRYRKLDDDSFVYGVGDGLSTSPSQSLSLPSNLLTGVSPSSPSNHKDSMARIREDISRYKYEGPPLRDDRGAEEQTKETSIPKVSSKWSQFMCEEESDDDEDDLLLRNFDSGVVTSGSAVAHYSAPMATKQ